MGSEVYCLVHVHGQVARHTLQPPVGPLQCFAVITQQTPRGRHLFLVSLVSFCHENALKFPVDTCDISIPEFDRELLNATIRIVCRTFRTNLVRERRFDSLREWVRCGGRCRAPN